MSEGRNSGGVSKNIFYLSAFIVSFLICIISIYSRTIGNLLSELKNWLINHFGWFYILSVGVIFFASIFFAISKYGNIKLGPNQSTPDYTYSSWFAMLFSAGMGIGLMFFGVAEPIIHFLHPPVAQSNLQNVQESMKICFFHWGFHAWAIYGIVALILSYFSYRHKLPLTIRSALFPFIGNKIYGFYGNLVDIFAIIGTIFGVAASLGYGAAQINSGLNFLFGIEISKYVEVIIIFIVMGISTASVSSGLNKGIRILSNINLVMAVCLLIFIFVAGPTVFLLKVLVQNTGAYLSDIVYKTFNLYAYESSTWIGSWTLLSWCWWLAWSPFVGLFIAKISRGRTIREFMLGVLIVPSLFTITWMTVFGNSAIDLITNKNCSDLANAAVNNTPLALFVFLQQFPLANLLCVLAIIMIVIFFVTSADSGTLVVSMLAAGGKEKTLVSQRVFWSVCICLSGVSLLLSGGLEALQCATIISALPFTIILLIAIYGLIKALRVEGIKHLSIYHPSNTTTWTVSGTSFTWKNRIKSLFKFPSKSAAEKYLQETANAAFEEIASELKKQNLTVILKKSTSNIHLEIFHGEEVDFIYGIQLRPYSHPSLGMLDITDDDVDKYKKYYRADVYLREGSQDYDVMWYSKEQIIGDILNQYEKHMHFITLLSQT